MKIPILIVDDNQVDRYVLVRLLKKTTMEFTVFEEKNGADAVEFFSCYQDKQQEDPDNYPPAVIFLDINMPLMNGLEFLQRFEQLRKGNALSSISVLMLSGAEIEAEREKALKYDFVKDYIVKSNISSQLLKERIQSVIGSCTSNGTLS